MQSPVQTSGGRYTSGSTGQCTPCGSDVSEKVINIGSEQLPGCASRKKLDTGVDNNRSKDDLEMSSAATSVQMGSWFTSSFCHEMPSCVQQLSCNQHVSDVSSCQQVSVEFAEEQHPSRPGDVLLLEIKPPDDVLPLESNP